MALKDDGSLSIDENKLKAADTDTLKKAFGTSSEFAKRLGIIGSNVSSLAKANINYVTSSLWHHQVPPLTHQMIYIHL
ncbi:MAG: hypothetical protein ACLR7D_07595 [Lachnospira eligens]